MIDRHGNFVRVGWLAHEMLWLEAAMDLPMLQRSSAYRDIADLTGRSESAVRYKAGELRAARERASRVVMVTAVPFRRASPKPKALPSDLRGPTKEQLMAGKARPSRHIHREAAE